MVLLPGCTSGECGSEAWQVAGRAGKATAPRQAVRLEAQAGRFALEWSCRAWRGPGRWRRIVGRGLTELLPGPTSVPFPDGTLSSEAHGG